MSLVVVGFTWGILALACAVAMYVISSHWAERRPRPALKAADQGPRGGHLGWFEGRWARVLQPDVLYAVVVMRDRLLLLRVGGQFSGRQGYGGAVAFAREARRRAKFTDELAAAGSPDTLLGRHRRDLAIPLHEVRRATIQARREFGWTGPAKLVIERVSTPAMALILEDGWQIAACARALQAVLGEAVRVDPVLAPMLADTEAGILEFLARRNEIVHRVLGGMYGCFAALVLFVLWMQTHPGPEAATTARLMSCETVWQRRSDLFKMELDGPPRDLRLEVHGEDLADLREACRDHAYVRVVYRQERVDRPAWAHAIAYADGREIVSGEAVARRERSNVTTGAGFDGVLAGIAAGMLTMPAWARRRRERRALGTSSGSV